MQVTNKLFIPWFTIQIQTRLLTRGVLLLTHVIIFIYYSCGTPSNSELLLLNIDYKLHLMHILHEIPIFVPFHFNSTFYMFSLIILFYFLLFPFYCSHLISQFIHPKSSQVSSINKCLCSCHKAILMFYCYQLYFFLLFLFLYYQWFPLEPFSTHFSSQALIYDMLGWVIYFPSKNIVQFCHWNKCSYKYFFPFFSPLRLLLSFSLFYGEILRISRFDGIQ